MKSHLIKGIKLTGITLVFFGVVYPLVVWSIAQLTPSNGMGETITVNSKTYYSNIGQLFTSDKYFWSRPSAVEYNAAGSAGSNKGPSNQDYLAEVQARINTFLDYNPDVKKEEIPADLVTASGSGLDPNISVQAAKVQVNRIAKVRNISEIIIYQIIEQQIEKPLLGLLGTEKINVLKLNLALDNLK